MTNTHDAAVTGSAAFSDGYRRVFPRQSAPRWSSYPTVRSST